MKNTIQDKTKLVNSVFSKVNKKYDLMNDIMSLGIHRIWKKKFLEWMRPYRSNTLIDVASGTGDIAKMYSKIVKGSPLISCVEPNKEMFQMGKETSKEFHNILWHKASAEKLPFKSNTYDFYSISFGLRNVSDINLSLKEAYRVLKPGGRFMCLEFSKVDNELINLFYKNYSRVIPFIGKFVVGSSTPYDYLVKSIDNFHNQEKLASIMRQNGFSKVEYRNLSSGISAIHSGWKI